jgi:hypothetical protein
LIWTGGLDSRLRLGRAARGSRIRGAGRGRRVPTDKWFAKTGRFNLVEGVQAGPDDWDWSTNPPHPLRIWLLDPSKPLREGCREELWAGDRLVAFRQDTDHWTTIDGGGLADA